MDKVEFREKYQEIKKLIGQGKMEEASDLVDSVNWRKVHNVNALVSASEVCEALGRDEEAKELLYIAHERSPIGRTILYHLAMLCIKLGELEEAQEHYETFVEIAPHDSLKYIIKYNISKAKGADENTLIAILEELKAHDFLEEWAYELAYLYHKTMQVEKCIDLCDEIILWFGDGLYVERALEMKMIYQPLDKNQEEKYRSFQNRRDGLTEVRANELLDSGEIVAKTVAIPQVKLPAERFNTVNLQAEIKKNIDEIMRATEEESVHENMENIKTLVEEIPYLQVNEQEESIVLEQQQAAESIDATIRDTFQEYLAEEYDGQISLFVPEEKEVEEQVEGQMTIEEVMEEWEKTRRAAEATLQEAQQQKLASAKNIALMEAEQIMDRLEEAIPKLDAGVTPTDLLKEEYLAKEPASSEPAETSVELKPDVFSIPKVAAAGAVAGVGLEIPVVHLPEGESLGDTRRLDTAAIAKAAEAKDTEEWNPPAFADAEDAAEAENNDEEVSDVNLKEASKMVEDVNNILQKEIDRILLDEMNEVLEETEPVDEVVEPEEAEASVELEEIEDLIEEEPEALVEEIEEDIKEDVEEVQDEILEEPVESEEEESVESEEVEEEEPIEETEPEVAEEELPEIADVELAPEEVAELVDETVLEKAVAEEIPERELSAEEKEIFSYFMPIAGMEKNICQALMGVRYHLEQRVNAATGNIIIEGNVGSGKTMLASNLIKVLQNETGFISGPVGKIDAKQLNNKDIKSVLARVKSGALIIEGAGDLSEESMTELAIFMSQADADVLIVLEDEKGRIENRLSVNPRFALMFTEKISIPVFTIDELVNFGKVYALEEGYAIDELGILAMYNRINLIQRLDHPTSLIEVKDIMEEAIHHAERGGLKGAFSRFGSKRYDEDGNLILREQDFSI